MPRRNRSVNAARMDADELARQVAELARDLGISRLAQAGNIRPPAITRGGEHHA